MTAQSDYRPEIDGLRAIAVWLVIVFHLGLLPLSGGFVGVDVFFVISGFVIARMIVASMQRASGFSFVTFYIRRILRLVPAMLAVSAFVLTAGWFQLGARDYASLGQAVVAANLFWSNWLFARLDGYFQADPSTLPLLHTWSLAVEEQFYLFAPVLLILFVRTRAWPWLLTATCLVSLGLAAAGGYRAADSAYYYTANRLFELGAGMALATVPQLGSFLAARGAALGPVGLALIFGSAVLVGRTHWFPGPLAVPVVIGTVFVIVAAQQAGWLKSVLSSRVLVFNGRLSYSLYLWHWPLLSVALASGFSRDATTLERTALAGAVVAIAALSYFFLEAPARRAATTQPWLALALTSVGLAVVLTSAMLIQHHGGVPTRLPADVAAIERVADDRGIGFERCRRKDIFGCTFGDSAAPAPSLLLWGDSHAAAWASAYDVLLREQRQSGVLIGSGACAALAGEDGRSALSIRRCSDQFAEVRAFLAANASVRHVVIGGRWALYAGSPVTGDVGRLAADEFTSALTRTLDEVTGTGRRVTIIGPVPELPFNVAAERVRAAMQGRRARTSIPAQEFHDRQARVLTVLDSVGSRRGVTVVNPHTLFCSGSECSAIYEGITLYWDPDHLNAHGAQRANGLLRADLLKLPQH